MIDPKFKYQVFSNAHWSETEPWLLEHIGEWDKKWYRIHDDIAMVVVGGDSVAREYWFTDERDAFLFKLRWV